MRSYIERKVRSLTDLFNAHSPAAKQMLHHHLSAISMHPVKDSERGWYYQAEGSWNLLVTDKNGSKLLGTP